MSKRKTKPATAGERVTLAWYGKQLNLAHLRDAPLPALPPGTRVHADLTAFAQALLEDSDS